MAKRTFSNVDDYWRARGYATGQAVPGGYVVGSGPDRPKPNASTVKSKRRATRASAWKRLFR